MWLKNITIFQASNPLQLTAGQIEEQLEQALCPPCGGQTLSTEGFAPPIKGQSAMVYATDELVLAQHQQIQRLLPAAVIGEQVEERVAAIFEQENRIVGRRERSEIKDQVIFELMPRAFTKTRYTSVVIDLRHHQVWVDSAAQNRAEQVLEKLREALGSLPVEPVTMNAPAEAMMSEWLANPSQLIEGFSLGDRCEFKDKGDTRGVVRCTQVDLTDARVLAHLEADMQVTKLNLCWQDWLEFDLTDQYSLKRINALDQLDEQMQDLDAADEVEELTSMLALQGGTLRQVCNALFALR